MVLVLLETHNSKCMNNHQGFIQDFFLGGGGDVDACKGCMCASVQILMKFWTFSKDKNRWIHYNTSSL